jgi:DNA-binding response OmpR family regulator
VDDIVEAQRVEIEVLNERLRQALEALSPPEFSPPVEWGLKATEARLFAHLRSRPIVTKTSLAVAAYGHMMGDRPADNTVESHISRLRKKIAPYGYRIESERFSGYRLVSETMDPGPRA